MRLTLNRIENGDEEVIVHYREMNDTIKTIASIVRGTEQKLQAVLEKGTVFLLPEQIYYLENVDGITYAYLANEVARVPESLRALEICYGSRGFFRCSKSMILNIYKISFLKSEPCGRIRATMENGEQVIISRKYAKELRLTLGSVK